MPPLITTVAKVKSAVNGLVGQIKSMRAEGNNVVFELDSANADFPYILSDYHLIIILQPMAK